MISHKEARFGISLKLLRHMIISRGDRCMPPKNIVLADLVAALSTTPAVASHDIVAS